MTAALVERGHERFDIHCAVCHGYAGDGDSVVASKMSLRGPPTLHRRQGAAPTPVEKIFDVATKGYGYMPQVRRAKSRVADRWAIANYVKALQLSQHASLDDVPADKRGDLDKPADPPARSEHGGAHQASTREHPKTRNERPARKSCCRARRGKAAVAT